MFRDNVIRDLEKELGIDEALAIEASRIRVRVDNRRYGKSVTVLAGFDDGLDLVPLAKALKNKLGAGGTVKDRTIELQGDHRKDAVAWLRREGFDIEP
jgi:translation initiation factor 1